MKFFSGKEKDNRPKRSVSFPLACLIIIIFSLSCLVSGYAIGYKFFWQKFETKSSADADILAFSVKVKQNPKDAQAWSKLAWLAFQKKQFDLAVQSSKRVLELVPDEPNAHYVLGLIYYEQKNYALAEQEFSVLYQKYPKNTLALLGLGKVYLAQEQSAKAIPVLESLTRLDKPLADGHLCLGEAYVKQGETKKALEEFNEVLRFNPENQQAKDWISKLGNSQPNPSK